MQKLMLHLSWHIAKESYLQQSEKWMIVWFTETKFGINNVCENKQEFLLSVGKKKTKTVSNFRCIETSPNNPVKNDIAKEIWNILQEK